MDTAPDLSGQDDVYASSATGGRYAQNQGRYLCRVLSDSEPTALARIFGLLSNMSVVPSSVTCLTVDASSIATLIKFETQSATAADMLRRKIHQLTETIEVSLGDDGWN